MHKEKKQIQILGRVASIMSILMYISYVPQIVNNLAGNYGSPVQPFVAMINCTFWTIYGLFKSEKDWPIVFANIPGIILGAITFITSLN